MTTIRKLGVIGGDARMGYLAAACAGRVETVTFYMKNMPFIGEAVRAASPDELAGVDALVLPHPATRDGVHILTPLDEGVCEARAVFEKLSPGVPVFGGAGSEKLREAAQAAGVRLTGYAEGDAFKEANAVPTAEGAIALAVLSSPYSLCGEKGVVSGYGRIGRALAARLKALGMAVTAVSASEGKRREIEQAGMTAVPYEEADAALAGARFVFNTAPARVFDAHIGAFAAGVCYIELASPPYGLDAGAAKDAGVLYVDGAALPGRFSPAKAGEIAAARVFSLLEETRTEKKGAAV